MPLNILRGLFRGATRGVMTGKRGNKNFYKGRGVRNPGYHTPRDGNNGSFEGPTVWLVNFSSSQTQEGLRFCFQLKPYVSYKSPKVEISPPTAESLLTSIKENIHLIKYRETP